MEGVQDLPSSPCWGELASPYGTLDLRGQRSYGRVIPEIVLERGTDHPPGPLHLLSLSSPLELTTCGQLFLVGDYLRPDLIEADSIHGRAGEDRHLLGDGWSRPR